MIIKRILVVDDDVGVRVLLTDILAEKGYTVLGVESIHQARQQMKEEPFELILCDVRLKDGDGLKFLEELHEVYPRLKMIVITGFGTLDSAVASIRLGVFDYLTKPIDISRLEVSLNRLEAFAKLEAENKYLRKELANPGGEETIWGESDLMKNVRDLTVKVGATDTTVLIQGESGCGKEVVARAIYEASPRANKPYIKVNCAAVPATLLETEFFGHEKGAFTGAVQRREGRFELADGGTLLLDEISEIPPELQAKLLRVLQEKEFERVGGNKSIRVDVRILATTNRRLHSEVAGGRFREDLYYRLNVVPIEIPPLRARGEDCLLIARHFLEIFCRKHGKNIPGLSKEAVAKILDHRWPGNVRELQNSMERAVILATEGTELNALDIVFGTAVRDPSEEDSASDELTTLGEMERRLIRKTLKHCKGNRTHASRRLGISLRTLRNKLASYREAGIEIE